MYEYQSPTSFSEIILTEEVEWKAMIAHVWGYGVGVSGKLFTAFTT